MWSGCQVFFFFQAEDGIRDVAVTGVQTCALPISRSEKVAIIGSGPAGMPAAPDLALLGYPFTIFEAAAVPGGMMHRGIPEYRLPRDVLQAQIREILDLGPELLLHTRLGRDFSLEDLRRQGYQAILMAFGLHRSRDLHLPGNDLDGVVKGIDFLLNVNLGYRFQIGKQVVVIGDRKSTRLNSSHGYISYAVFCL